MAQLDFSTGRHFRHRFDFNKEFDLVSDNHDGTGWFRLTEDDYRCNPTGIATGNYAERLSFSDLIRLD